MEAKNESSVQEVQEAVSQALERHQRMMSNPFSSTIAPFKGGVGDDDDLTTFYRTTRTIDEPIVHVPKSRISSLLEFADIGMDDDLPPEVVKARKELVAKANEEEAAEKKVEPTRPSDKLTATVPTKLLHAWKYRRAVKFKQQEEENKEEPLKNKGQFSIDKLSKIKGKFKEVGALLTP